MEGYGVAFLYGSRTLWVKGNFGKLELFLEEKHIILNFENIHFFNACAIQIKPRYQQIVQTVLKN